MGRPPLGGGPAFRFTQSEVLEMESCLNEVNYSIPSREVMCSLADKFSASADRVGRIVVQPKQVWNWFQNRRYAQRAKVVKPPVKLAVSPMARDDSHPVRTVAPTPAAPADNAQVEFEAKSARDGAWYDVAAFLSHRMFETSDPEVRVRFAGFGVEEDEWINVRNCVRQRSLPCEAGECVVVLPGDLILCFLEGTEQALYFDAHVLDAQRRRHDVRGCRCRFLVRYDHNQSEEIVPLRKICRRPETDHRLQMLTASEAPSKEDGLSKDANMTPSPQKSLKQFKLMNVNTNEVTTAPVVTIAVAAAAPAPPAAAPPAAAPAAAAAATAVAALAPQPPAETAAAPAAAVTIAVAAAPAVTIAVAAAPAPPAPPAEEAAATAAVTTTETDHQLASDIIMADAVVTNETSDKPNTADIS